MSPTSTKDSRTARNKLVRKIAICAAALAVTVLPTACDAAFASSGGHDSHGEVVRPVGGSTSDDTDDNAGGDESTGEDGSDNGADNGADGDTGGDEGAAPETPAGDNGDNGGEDAGDGDNAGDDAGGDNGDAGGDDAGDNGGDDNAGGDENAGGDNGGGDGGNAGGDNGGGGQENNGLDVLGRDCSNSDLPPHTGFQVAPACVDTAFGEVASEDQSPSLLITNSPDTVRAGESFTIEVSTRNLIRDRFLGAAAGGYYLESSFLDENGIQRGHFHTACRMLDSTDAAPDAAPVPAFFLATQDNGGGADPDTVTITVTGMPTAGTAQCAVWAGDGSHRVPMMQRANQTPAFDAVRITVE